MRSQSFEVTPSMHLKGKIRPQGAKNEALQVICATLLTADEVTIHNIPDILDVRVLISLLDQLGIETSRIGTDSYTFKANQVDLKKFGSTEFQKNAKMIRGSVLLLGPLLGRFKKAYIPKPGGDKIGRRKLDTHFVAFQKLGAEFKYEEHSDTYFLDAGRLDGTYILMDEISVTGTANLVMAAVLAKGRTKIYNAACEPYIQQLCKMLNRMGAKISGVGSNLLEIEGVEELKGTTHTIMPDMIEIGSFIGMAAMTQSEITIENANSIDLGMIIPVFSRMGIIIEELGDDLLVPYQERYAIQSNIDGSIPTIYDAPWPGFSPDLISIALVIATQAEGSVLIHQKMFESRLFFVDKLIDMGAKIILCDPHRATVIGLNRESPLRGIEMTSPDIRAGVSLLIAAMSAKGNSLIHQIQQIDRGYQNIDERLNALGANIRRVDR